MNGIRGILSVNMLILRILVPLLFCSITNAACVIYSNDSPLSKAKSDAVATLLGKVATCPQSIRDVKQILQKNSLKIKTSMVANRGKNNPILGSFSFFESISGTLPDGFQIDPGDFFLGYFTTLGHNEIMLDQLPEKNKLLIELIAWDKNKQYFNFYELRGLDSSNTRWFYRGNSKDALLDNEYLYRKSPYSSEKFGNRMRCSACHNSGGPIMKEIKTPHNDWWNNSNRLIFSPNHLNEDVSLLVNHLINAKDFSNEVYAGINKLNRSASFKKLKKSISLQEQLRPLFCTTEINIESNKNQGIYAPITIPSGFFINPLLGKLKVVIPEQAYQSLLTNNNMQFPETLLNDADHAWLTPVKGINDINAIKQLIKDKVASSHFIQSVLMIDYSHPIFSRQRCELLELIPDTIDLNWIDKFINKLYQEQENKSEALLLASYLTNSEQYNHNYFQQILSEYTKKINRKIKSNVGLQEIFKQLLESRQGVLDNELSKNPLGQILEPGFRVIFPISANHNRLVG